MNETEIFSRAIAESDAKLRAKIVDELCGNDTQLKSRIENLLAAHDQPETFLDRPVAPAVPENDSPTVAPDPVMSLEQTGSQIGPYKLLQQIGEGGMGMVYMAEQLEPVKRRVALKLIKPGMDSRQIIARFEAERQALAMMDHPNIARVLDAGTTERGQPYFVMELVNGLPITEYCDQEKLSPHERLHLFVSVCRAVQHAHQKGVIHRDLKPNNILVAEYDGFPVPKIIDFGVAKATGSQLTDKTLFTEFGQVVGTLEYMSPEQARRNQLDVDTRSDIYSLGIVLYSLLTGETPFGRERFREAAWDEMLKIIREEEPQRPSLKIGSSQTLEQVATVRSVEAKRLSSLVRGDLDWIVMKTLEKDRNKRYASASELADDINRHLHEEPVVARPPSAHDRLSKLIRRNRGKFAISTVLLAIAIGSAAWFYYSATQRAKEVTFRTQQLESAMNDASLSLVQAESSAIGNDAPWNTAAAQIARVQDLLDQGKSEPATIDRAKDMIADFRISSERRQIATQIEEVVMHGATNPALESWQRMESDMRDFFRKHGFNIGHEKPMAIGQRIRNHRFSVLWADLLELWIATRGQMSSIGGEKMTEKTMQPWAEAIYEADADPVRTGIRRFIYEGPPRTRGKLDRLVEDVDLTVLPPRTLSWLATTYGMAGANDEAERILEIALIQYPKDFMLAFDTGLFFASQQRWEEAARMYHRCIPIRDDVAGIWSSLATALDKLGDPEAAARARARAEKLTGE